MSALASRVILLTIAEGLHPASTLGFAAHAISLLATFRAYGLAYEFGKLALEIARRYNDRAQLCRATNVMITFISHWSRPFEEDDELIRVGFRAGVESGEQQYSSYALAQHVVNQYVRGVRLPELAERVASALAYVTKTKTEINRVELIGQSLIIANLRGQTAGPDDFTTSELDEGSILAAAEAGQMLYSVCQYEIDKGQALYLHQRYTAAAEQLAAAGGRLMYITGCSKLVEHHFYSGLTHAARHAEGDVERQRSGLAALDEHIEALAHVAAHYEGNTLHKLRLLQAERARITGQHWAAVEAYDQAIALAAEHHFLQTEALAHWLAGRFWLEHEKQHLAAPYLRRAYDGFRAWGAVRVADTIERMHPDLRARRDRDGTDVSSSWTATLDENGLNRRLDLRTVIEAWHGITSEHDLARLLARVMHVSLENAGAGRGLLLLLRDELLLAKARGALGAEFELEQLSVELEQLTDLSQAVVRYVIRTGERVVIDDARKTPLFADDAYLRTIGASSVVCVPLRSQGTLIGAVYMENRNVSAAFTRERVDVLELLMTPAAIAIDNARLKRSDEDAFVFQVGGSLAASACSYVQRRADQELQRAVMASEFCYVLCPRQLGKSSLRVQATHALTQRGVTCISLDLTVIGSRGISAEQWYASVARRLLGGSGVSLREWWRAHDHLAPVQRLAELIETELLGRIEGPLAIFIDEIDSMLSLDFVHDDFFAMLRGLYNMRADDPRYRRLSVVLLGVCSPAQLISDISRTPFNIGRHISLDRFRVGETDVLLDGLAHTRDARAVLEAVLAWTGGHPFLTQKVCSILAQLETTPLPGQASQWVGQAVLGQIIHHWETRDEPVHLRTIRDRIMRSVRRDLLLARYREIHASHAGVESGEHGVVDTELLLSGLVVEEAGRLRVGNRIYERVFDLAWVDSVHGPVVGAS
jgi:GAF domain-containing protein